MEADTEFYRVKFYGQKNICLPWLHMQALNLLLENIYYIFYELKTFSEIQNHNPICHFLTPPPTPLPPKTEIQEVVAEIYLCKCHLWSPALCWLFRQSGSLPVIR